MAVTSSASRVLSDRPPTVEGAQTETDRPRRDTLTAAAATRALGEIMGDVRRAEGRGKRREATPESESEGGVWGDAFACAAPATPPDELADSAPAVAPEAACEKPGNPPFLVLFVSDSEGMPPLPWASSPVGDSRVRRRTDCAVNREDAPGRC